MAGGRPKFKIDYEAVEKLSTLQCTQEEIASYLGCSVDTLQRDDKFCGIYKKGMDHGKMSLRRKQWRAAEDGNTTMLVWLGKQYLGQRDISRQELTGAEGKEFKTGVVILPEVNKGIESGQVILDINKETAYNIKDE